MGGDPFISLSKSFSADLGSQLLKSVACPVFCVMVTNLPACPEAPHCPGAVPHPSGYTRGGISAPDQPLFRGLSLPDLCRGRAVATAGHLGTAGDRLGKISLVAEKCLGKRNNKDTGFAKHLNDRTVPALRHTAFRCPLAPWVF